jgi:hypothetical protein
VRLDRAVAASGRLSVSDLEGLAVGMAAALTAIHGAGVVHRDLKPSNVLLSYFGPKVIDFGIARALDASASTATGKLMGSPGWMAPEQFAQRPVTAAVDIFVWGSLVAYAGTGRRPFGQGTVVEMSTGSGTSRPTWRASRVGCASWSRAARPRRRVRRWLALLGLVAVAAVLVTRLVVLDRSPAGQPAGASVAATSQPANAAPQAGPPPLCELLGDLGVGRTLGAPSGDRGFAAAADAAGGWLAEPAALPRALRDHRFQSGCTRTWSQPAGPVVAALFQFPSRTDARAMRGQLRDALGERGLLPVRVPQVTGGELYLLEPGGGSGQLVMFACNERVLQLHVGGSGPTPDPLLVRLAQGSNRRLHERTGCPR